MFLLFIFQWRREFPGLFECQMTYELTNDDFEINYTLDKATPVTTNHDFLNLKGEGMGIYLGP